MFNEILNSMEFKTLVDFNDGIIVLKECKDSGDCFEDVVLMDYTRYVKSQFLKIPLSNLSYSQIINYKYIESILIHAIKTLGEDNAG